MTGCVLSDAAGLVDASTGGGIHFAVQSACLLAESFAGGTPYEEAMRPTLAGLSVQARQNEALYRQLGMRMMLDVAGFSLRKQGKG